MNQIIFFGDKLSADEFVRITITSSRGKRSSCTKKDLETICEQAGIKPAWNDTKETLYDKIIKNHVYDGREMAQRFQAGVTMRMYVNQFKISPQIVRKLEKEGIIHAIGQGDSYECGKKFKETLYDPYEFESMNPDTIREFYLLHRIEGTTLK